MLSSLNPATFTFVPAAGTGPGLDTGGTFEFGFGPISGGPSTSYSITSTSSFWNAASFLGTSTGGSVAVDHVNYGPYYFYSEAILSHELYLYASSYNYYVPEPSRPVGIVGMGLVASIGLCVSLMGKLKIRCELI